MKPPPSRLLALITDPNGDGGRQPDSHRRAARQRNLATAGGEHEPAAHRRANGRAFLAAGNGARNRTGTRTDAYLRGISLLRARRIARDCGRPH